jgi:pilus assembly protein CpaF
MTTQNQDPLDVLTPLLTDPDVAEIMIDGASRVYAERKGQLEDVVPSPFRDDNHVLEVIAAIAEAHGRVANESTPLLDLRLPDGSRVNVVLPPISLSGPIMTIRKFAKTPPTVEDLVRWGSWDERMVQFLQACVQSRLNIFVAGGTGSGKTTVLNLIANMIPNEERIIAIQNAAELDIRKKRLIQLETRPANIEGRGEVSMRDLVINALRMRPDRIVVGELMGGEALDLLQALNTGHDGGMTSLHANGIRDVLARLEAMAAMAEAPIPLLTIRQTIASAIDIIIYQERLQDGSRKILKLAEVAGLQGDAVVLNDIFEFRQTGFKEGKIKGRLTATGQIPRSLERIRAAGVELPLDMFTPS